jgi:phosphatidylserine/phosphatidylglycerophosphate/cardiolipin synthase-like enzyme
MSSTSSADAASAGMAADDTTVCAGPGFFLTAAERGNPHTTIDDHTDGRGFTRGNQVQTLVHGANYFHELAESVRATQAGDLIMFTDWRGDPDEFMDGYHVTVSNLLCEAAGRGVVVKGLVWRSHWDRLQFSAEQNRYLGKEIEAAGGEVLRDMRVRAGGSHHQKMVVIRYRHRPQDDVAFVGGIDLCHSRGDNADHVGDPQTQQMSGRYGTTPPWHDVQLAIKGPAVAELEFSFRERWCDPSPLSRNLVHIVTDFIRRDDTVADPLPAPLPDPPAAGRLDVQVLRTYPYRRNGFPFAPLGERSIARAYAKAVSRAKSFIYIEDQYLWSSEVVDVFAEALRREPDLLMVCVVPMHPDQDGISGAAQTFGRERAIERLSKVGGDRIAVYGIENEAGTPIYVHAKVCVIDDTWTCVGSDNLNLRSWTHDSELSCAIQEPDGGVEFGRDVRLGLHREHLQRDTGDDADLIKPQDLFHVYAQAADALDAWHGGDQTDPRPTGRLRRYRAPDLSRWTRMVAGPFYRLIADPDGRPRKLRRAGEF